MIQISGIWTAIVKRAQIRTRSTRKSRILVNYGYVVVVFEKLTLVWMHIGLVPGEKTRGSGRERGIK